MNDVTSGSSNSNNTDNQQNNDTSKDLGDFINNLLSKAQEFVENVASYNDIYTYAQHPEKWPKEGEFDVINQGIVYGIDENAIVINLYEPETGNTLGFPTESATLSTTAEQVNDFQAAQESGTSLGTHMLYNVTKPEIIIEGPSAAIAQLNDEELNENNTVQAYVPDGNGGYKVVTLSKKTTMDFETAKLELESAFEGLELTEDLDGDGNKETYYNFEYTDPETNETFTMYVAVDEDGDYFYPGFYNSGSN